MVVVVAAAAAAAATSTKQIGRAELRLSAIEADRLSAVEADITLTSFVS